MNSSTLIKTALATADFVIRSYLADLSDEEIMMPPVQGANPPAWQIGHLILSEYRFVEDISPGVSPPLTPAFIVRHGKDGVGNHSATDYLTVRGYRDLMTAQRAATLTVLDSLSEDDLGAPAPETMRGYAPTVGAAFIVQPGHWMMHAGQIAVLRRSLGKPVRI